MEESDLYTGKNFLTDALISSGVILLLLGVKLNKKNIKNKTSHTFFFINIEYWSAIYFLVSAYLHI